MCRFKSYIVTKDLKVHGSRRTSSHEDILEELKIEDGKDQNAILMREHVKIEVYPKDDNKKTRNLADWIYREDEPGTLPEWYQKNKARIEETVLLQLTEDLQVQLAMGEEEREVTDTEIYVFDSSKVVAWGSSKVVARGSSQVVAWGSSKVDARGSSQVDARGSSKVDARGSSKVDARGSSKVDAWDSSKVDAWDSSQVVAWDSSQVVARGSSQVDARDSSKVDARDSSKVDARGSSKVDARDSSKVVAWGSSQVVAWDSSQVDARGSSKVEISSEFAVVSCHGKIFVNKKATVIVQDKVEADKV
jgi:hypothetical protein